MRWAIALGLIATLAACGVQTGRQASAPPARYQGDATAAVQFLAPEQAVDVCAGAAHEAGTKVEGCTQVGRMVMVNPCAWPGSDPYAEQLCHELGHWNGWPASHPQ